MPKKSAKKKVAKKTVSKPAKKTGKKTPAKKSSAKSVSPKTRAKTRAKSVAATKNKFAKEAEPLPIEPEILKEEEEEEDTSLEDIDPIQEEPEEETDTEIDVGETRMVPAKPGTMERANLLQRYLMEVRQYQLLTKEEEHQLALLYQEKGDVNAARKLVTSNLRLVVKIALEYYRHWMDLLDLIQEGNVGLMQAVKKFDPYRGIRLSTYSSFWIRAYILKFLMDNWRLVKIGTTQAQRKLFFNLKKEKERLEQFGFNPGPRMLADSLDVKESEVLEMDQRLSARDESLDMPVTEDGKQTREMVLADEQRQVDEVIAEDQFARIIKRKLTAFRERLNEPGNEKEAFIYDHRLLSNKPITLQQVGDNFDISRERVRQLEARLVQRIREYLKAEMPEYEDSEFVLQ